MARPRYVTEAGLVDLLGDGELLARGVQAVDRGGVRCRVRSGTVLFCEAEGGGAARLRVAVSLDSDPGLGLGALRAGCTCSDISVHGLCEHAAALLVAWARDPEGFAVSDVEPFDVGLGVHRASSPFVGKRPGREVGRVRGLPAVGLWASTAQHDPMLQAGVGLATSAYRSFARLADADLMDHILPVWADGAASPHIARALARGSRRSAALDVAMGALQLDAGRTVKMTALQVLQATGSEDALALLKRLAQTRRADIDPCLRGAAFEALQAARQRAGRRDISGRRSAAVRVKLATLVWGLRHGPSAQQRARCARQLARLGCRGAIVELRAAFARAAVGGAETAVREQTAYALARLGDSEMLGPFVAMLRHGCAGESVDEASIAVRALGYLGDVRGATALMELMGDRLSTPTVGAALAEMGAAAAAPLVQALAARPEPSLVEQAWVRRVVQQTPPRSLARMLPPHLVAARGSADFAARAQALLTVASVHGSCASAVGRLIVEMTTAASSEAERRLRRAAQVAAGRDDGARALRAES